MTPTAGHADRADQNGGGLTFNLCGIALYLWCFYIYIRVYTRIQFPAQDSGGTAVAKNELWFVWGSASVTLLLSLSQRCRGYARHHLNNHSVSYDLEVSCSYIGSTHVCDYRFHSQGSFLYIGTPWTTLRRKSIDVWELLIRHLASVFGVIRQQGTSWKW